MSEQAAPWATTNSGYTQNLDYDNNGVPDWQQDIQPIHPDGYARDMNRNIIRDPEPFVISRDTISPGFSDRSYRDDVANLTATFDPSLEHTRGDLDRDSISDANRLMRAAEHDLDKRAGGVAIDPDALLANSLVRGAWEQRSAMTRARTRDGLYNSMRSNDRDPSDSGFDILMHATKSFAKGWAAQRAKTLTLESQKMNQIDTILAHAMRHNDGTLNDTYRCAIDKIYPGLCDRLVAANKFAMDETSPELPAGQIAPAEEVKALGQDKPTEWVPQSAIENAKPAEIGAPQADAAKPADEKQPQIEGPKSAEADQHKAENAPDVAAAVKDGTKTGTDNVKVDEISRPFREPWPYNPRIIEKAANDPASVSREELVDAYASARGEQEMLRRLETRVRSVATGVPEAKLAGMKLSDQKKAAGGIGFGESSEARTRLNLRTDQIKTLSAEMKVRGIQTKEIDRECALRARELPLVIPGIQTKPLLEQAVHVRKAMGLSRFEAENPVNIEAKSFVRPFVPPRGPRVPMPGMTGVASAINTAIKAAQTVDQSMQAAQRNNEGLTR